ncbi:hypothetical protein PFISCL1PPCAC_8827, partial [Pristionchus fissidentatus]
SCTITAHSLGMKPRSSKERPVHDAPSLVDCSAKDLRLCTVGSRVFFIGAKENKRDDRGKIFSLLELNPTLFDHSM